MKENRTIETVWAVQVADRMDGLYLFRQLSDAELFLLAVESGGGSATLSDTPINHSHTAAELIAQERGDG